MSVDAQPHRSVLLREVVDLLEPAPDAALVHVHRGKTMAEIVQLLLKYSNNQIAEALVKSLGVLETGAPELQDVQRTNRCVLAVHQSGPLCVVTSAIDNLVKGASGQALQNMNLMLGLSETEGLQ